MKIYGHHAYIYNYIYITVYLGLLFNDYWYFYGRVAVYLLPFERPSGPSSPQQWQSPCRPCPCRPPRRRWSGCGGSGGDGLQLWYGRNIVWCMYMTYIYIYMTYMIYMIYIMEYGWIWRWRLIWRWRHGWRYWYGDGYIEIEWDWYGWIWSSI